MRSRLDTQTPKSHSPSFDQSADGQQLVWMKVSGNRSLAIFAETTDNFVPSSPIGDFDEITLSASLLHLLLCLPEVALKPFAFLRS